jgi:hypothetical protein
MRKHMFLAMCLVLAVITAACGGGGQAVSSLRDFQKS